MHAIQKIVRIKIANGEVFYFVANFLNLLDKNHISTKN